MSSHSEHAAKQGLAVPCTAAHQTFGGRCLNCGYQDTDLYAENLQPDRAQREYFRGLLFWLRDNEPIGGDK
jgi:hypothetical protein